MTTTTDGEHAHSTYEIDIYWASGEPPDSELRRHLETCGRCRRYLEHLASLEAEPPLPARRSPRRSGARVRRFAAAVGVAGLAAAASVAIRFAGSPTSDEHGYVGAKGTPAVQALVRSGGETRIWDGRGAIHPGDAIALRVACEDFRYVTVATLARAGSGSSWERLSDLACRSDSPLPFTAVADQEGDSDRLAVVLSMRPIGDSALRTMIEREVRSADVWTVVLSFPKSKVLP